MIASERTTCCVQGSGRVWQWGNGMLSPTRVVFPNPWFELSKETASLGRKGYMKRQREKETQVFHTTKFLKMH